MGNSRVCLKGDCSVVLSTRIRALLPTFFRCADHIVGSGEAFHHCHVIILLTKLNQAAAGIG